MKKSHETLLDQANEAHSDVTVLYALIGMLEARALSTEAQKTEFQIIAICKREAQRAFVRFEKARDALAPPQSPEGKP